MIQGLRVVLVVCLGLAAVVTLGYLPAQGFWPFLALSLGHAAALAPVTILADALALGAAVPPPGSGRRGFEYGWVRGTGSAAFIGGTLLAGQAVSAWGLDVIVGLQALLLGAAAVAARRVPELRHARTTAAVARAGRRGAPAAAAAAIPPAGAGGRPRPGQPRHARRLCGDPLARGRREPGDGECALVGVGGRGGARVLPPRPGARDVADAGRGAGRRRPGRPGALGGDGAERRRAGAGPRAAAARPDLCAAPSRLHAAARPDRATGPGRDGAGALRHGRHRGHQCRTDPGLRRALRPRRGAGVLGHGGAVRAGGPIDVAAAAARGQRQRRALGGTRGCRGLLATPVAVLQRYGARGRSDHRAQMPGGHPAHAGGSTSFQGRVRQRHGGPGLSGAADWW